MVNRVRVAFSVKFFEQGFKQRWGLKDYNVSEPCVFLGCYSNADIEAILKHKPKKIVMLLGGDLGNLSKLQHDRSITFASDKQAILNIYAGAGVRYINQVIPLKSFDEFTPAPKGDKIYCYVNTGSESHLRKHGIAAIPEVIKHFGKDRFIFGTHGLTTKQVIQNYYNPAFVNLQLNQFAGFTSSIEMAYMGRKTISNTPAPFTIPFDSDNDIIVSIENEFKTPVEQNLINNYLCNKSDWLNL